MPRPAAKLCSIVRVKSANACVGCVASHMASFSPGFKRSIAPGSTSIGRSLLPVIGSMAGASGDCSMAAIDALAMRAATTSASK